MGAMLSVFNFASNSYAISCVWGFDLQRALERAAAMAAQESFLERRYPRPVDPNPLPILMRAVNALKLSCRVIFQPRWSCKRWRSTT